MIDTKNRKKQITELAIQLGISDPDSPWVRVINDISVHFAVWYGWSMDRTVALSVDEIHAKLVQEVKENRSYDVGRSFRHSEDFSRIIWRGKQYHLNRSQARVFELLYNESMQGTNGLHQSTLGKMLNSSNPKFRLLHVFRNASGEMHPIWGKLIISLEPGVYGIRLDEDA